MEFTTNKKIFFTLLFFFILEMINIESINDRIIGFMRFLLISTVLIFWVMPGLKK